LTITRKRSSALSIGNFVSENFHLAVKVKIGVTETLHQKEYSDVGTFKLANTAGKTIFVTQSLTGR